MFYDNSLDNLVFLSVQNHDIKYFDKIEMLDLNSLAFL